MNGPGTRKLWWEVRIAERWPTPETDLLPGDRAIVDREAAEVGECVAVAVGERGVVLRRVVLEAGELLLRAPDGGTTRPGELGKVMGVVRYVPMPRRSAVS